MTRQRRGAALVLIAVLVAGGCAAEPPPDPEMQLLLDLDAAHRPLFACVQSTLASRPDFAGSLPERFVDAGMADQLQALHAKYVGGSQPLAGAPRDARVAATQAALLALGRYGGGAAAPGESDRLRRMMAMVETTAAIAVVAGGECEPSDTLTSLMNKAEQR